jgi:hypothetical protein
MVAGRTRRLDLGRGLWFGASVQYQPFEHIGFGAGYDYVSGNLDSKDGEDKSSVVASYYGPDLLVTLNFL